MKKETRWVTYDGVDYYDLYSGRFDWKYAEIDNIWEAFKGCFVEKEKQVKNGM